MLEKLFNWYYSWKVGREYQRLYDIALKYLLKQGNSIDVELRKSLFKEYLESPVEFGPISTKIPKEDQEKVYKTIDSSDILSPQEKFETTLGLMMILGGSFPKQSIMLRLEKFLGKEFTEGIEEKRKEIEKKRLVDDLINFIDFRKKFPNDPYVKEVENYAKKAAHRARQELKRKHGSSFSSL